MIHVVAKLTHDHLDNKKGELEFTYDGFLRFWQGQMFGLEIPLDENGRLFDLYLDGLSETQFRLYDDDGELYYSGWLKNDDECMVQQFVLAWAMADSGCTTIKVKNGNLWETEIG